MFASALTLPFRIYVFMSRRCIQFSGRTNSLQSSTPISAHYRFRYSNAHSPIFCSSIYSRRCDAAPAAERGDNVRHVLSLLTCKPCKNDITIWLVYHAYLTFNKILLGDRILRPRLLVSLLSHNYYNSTIENANIVMSNDGCRR